MKDEINQTITLTFRNIFEVKLILHYMGTFGWKGNFEWAGIAVSWLSNHSFIQLRSSSQLPPFNSRGHYHWLFWPGENPALILRSCWQHYFGLFIAIKLIIAALSVHNCRMCQQTRRNLLHF